MAHWKREEWELGSLRDAPPSRCPLVRGYVEEIGLEDIATYCKDLETLGNLLMLSPQYPDYLTLGPLDAGFGALSGLLKDRVFYYIRAHAKNLEMLFVSLVGNSDLGLHNVLSLEIRDCSFSDKAVGQCCKAGDYAVSLDVFLFSKLWHMFTASSEVSKGRRFGMTDSTWTVDEDAATSTLYRTRFSVLVVVDGTWVVEFMCTKYRPSISILKLRDAVSNDHWISFIQLRRIQL
ncbi:hypothetical protein T459_15931 [Capsicum annuum]|uniref:Uncharacterized protein n=1 Tax=Capsicum annuum TaxID=4072 RepID=A0A2G2Z7D0_CAPAN|nr:hypothetical protein T459_15931 [Capsicum annuum]